MLGDQQRLTLKKGMSILYILVVLGAEQALQWLGNSRTSSGAEYLHSHSSSNLVLEARHHIGCMEEGDLDQNGHLLMRVSAAAPCIRAKARCMAAAPWGAWPWWGSSGAISGVACGWSLLLS